MTEAVGDGPARTPDLVAVARIVRAQGLRGEVRLEPLTDAPARLADLRACALVPPEDGERREVEAVWFRGPTPIAKLAGSETRDDAEALVGRFLAIPRQETRALPDDRFYVFDLVGCDVRTPEGGLIGSLVDVLGGDAHDLWVVRTAAGECLIPAVSAIVDRVDLAGRTVVVRPPDGLIELAS